MVYIWNSIIFVRYFCNILFSLQINLGSADKSTGRMTGGFITYTICGAIHRSVLKCHLWLLWTIIMFWSAGWEKVKTAPTDWPFNDKWSRRMESLTRSSDPVAQIYWSLKYINSMTPRNSIWVVDFLNNISYHYFMWMAILIQGGYFYVENPIKKCQILLNGTGTRNWEWMEPLFWTALIVQPPFCI